MPVNRNLNTILKEMWRLHEKLDNNQYFETSESVYWHQHLQIIKDYYEENAIKWTNTASKFTYKLITPDQKDLIINPKGPEQ